MKSFWIAKQTAGAAILTLTLAPSAAAAQATPAAKAPFTCASVQPQATAVPGARAYVYRVAAGRKLYLHVFSPAGASDDHPAIVFYFGGGWRAGDVNTFAERARAFAAAGYVAVLPDYRVSCRDQSTPADAVDDGKAAYTWVRNHALELGIDVKRIVLAGGSAGGHLALMTAINASPAQRPAALVLYNPAVDLSNMPEYISAPASEARKISPLHLSLRRLPPTIVMHGTADATVPIGDVRAFCARAKTAGARCDLVEYVGEDHAFFHHKAANPITGVAPYGDTMGRSLAFLDELNLPNFAAYLLAGQSNMSGRGFVAELSGADRIDNPRIRLYGNDGRYHAALDPLDFTEGQIDAISYDPIVGVGPGLSFARSMIAKGALHPILLVPCAKGGSAIKEWTPNYSRTTLYGSCLARARQTRARVAGVLWYQGEADAKSWDTARAWPTNFKLLVTHLRRDLGRARLPVVYVQISDPPLNSPNKAQFVAWAAVQSAQAVPPVACASVVSAVGLAHNPDDIHLSSRSQVELGARLAAAMTALQARGCR